MLIENSPARAVNNTHHRYRSLRSLFHPFAHSTSPSASYRASVGPALGATGSRGAAPRAAAGDHCPCSTAPLNPATDGMLLQPIPVVPDGEGWFLGSPIG